MQFDTPDRISLALPDSARVAKIRESLKISATPVRPLPSNAAIILRCALAFAILAIVFAAPVGFRGFAKLTPAGATIEYSVVLLLALILTGSALEQAIPGSRRIMPPALSVLLAILLLSVTAAVLFPDFQMRDFVRQEIPCLRFGVLCAIPAAGLAPIAMRRGFVTDPVPAAFAGGALSGLVGVGALALHCPIPNAAHIIVWHVAVIAVTSLLGASLARGVARYRQSS